MAHWCRICGSYKPDEKFSGKGRQNHICKECAKKSKAEIDSIDQEREIFGFMKQSHISRKNVIRLKTLMQSENRRIAELAFIVLEVAKVKPYKKRRLKVLAAKHQELFRKVKESGLIDAHRY